MGKERRWQKMVINWKAKVFHKAITIAFRVGVVDQVDEVEGHQRASKNLSHGKQPSTIRAPFELTIQLLIVKTPQTNWHCQSINKQNTPNMNSEVNFEISFDYWKKWCLFKRVFNAWLLIRTGSRECTGSTDMSNIFNKTKDQSVKHIEALLFP